VKPMERSRPSLRRSWPVRTAASSGCIRA
jgi:hypothetical protein